MWADSAASVQSSTHACRSKRLNSAGEEARRVTDSSLLSPCLKNFLLSARGVIVMAEEEALRKQADTVRRLKQEKASPEEVRRCTGLMHGQSFSIFQISEVRNSHKVQERGTGTDLHSLCVHYIRYHGSPVLKRSLGW